MKYLKKNLIIVQARLGSKRLRNKVLRKINKKIILYHVIDKLKKLKKIELVVATTKLKIDDKIVRLVQKKKIKVFRGENKNVLKRLLDAAIYFKYKKFIRISADSPLIDIKQIKKSIIFANKKKNFDIITNCFPRMAHHGQSVEIINTNILKKISKLNLKKTDKEHVTKYIYENSKNFNIFNFNYDKTKMKIKNLSVDTYNDLIKIRKIFKGKKYE